MRCTASSTASTATPDGTIEITDYKTGRSKNRSNEGGLGLFERHGFEREAVLRRHVRDGDGALQDLVVLARL